MSATPADTAATAAQQQLESTPVKTSEVVATDAGADAAAASASATPARLNANAKSFVPVKLDESAVDSAANNTSASATGADQKAKKGTERSPKAGGNKKAPPYANNGGKVPMPPPPGGFLMPGLMQPFMGMGVPPFVPSPMMMNNPMMMGMPMGGIPPPLGMLSPPGVGMPGMPGMPLPMPPMPNHMGVPPPMMMNPMGLNMMGMPPNMQGHVGMPMMPGMMAPSPTHPHSGAGPQLTVGLPNQMGAMSNSTNLAVNVGAGTPPAAGSAAAPATINGVPNPNTPATANTAAAAANAAANAAAADTTNSLMTLMPSSPMMATGGMNAMNASMNVSVGNASLAALRSNAPSRIACVILIGLPSSGKTTIGRQLVSELSEDKMGWTFFSGSDYLKESATKKAPWETTRDVFDGLGTYIDGMLANYATNPTRGLVIDKNVKGIEDIYYLAALLKSKNLQLNGIVSFDSTDDETLLERLGGEDGKERLKFYRVILNRIQEGTRGTNLFHVIDSSKPLVDSLKALRTQVLGCSAIQTVRPLNTSTYGDSNCQLVDDYAEYHRVLTAITSYAKTAKPNQFPGLINYTPLSNKTLDERKFRANLVSGEAYAVRRKVDGSKFILYHENQQLYLIPRHQRAILRVPVEAWVGFSLSSCGPFILDGELVRMSKDNNREKFLVYDVIFWAEKGSTQNICRGLWKERQDRLRAYLANESDGFFQAKTNMVIVHQKVVSTREIGQLFDNAEYPVEGLAFHTTARREEAVILWRPPRQITADFRIGATKNVVAPTITSPTSPKDNITTYTYELEVFDSKTIPARYAPYTRYGNVEVAVNGRQNPPTQGTIVSCVLQFEGEGYNGQRSWKYLCARPDLAISMFKVAADELLDECIVPKERLTKVLIDEKLMVDPAAKAAAEAAAQVAASRTAFGTHMVSPNDIGSTTVTVGVAVPPSQRSMRDVLIGGKAGEMKVTVGSPLIKVGGTPLPTSPQPRFGGAAEGSTPTVTVGVGANATTISGAAAAAVAAAAASAAANATAGADKDAATDVKGEPKRRGGRDAEKEAKKDATEKEGAATDAKRRCADCKREKNEADGRVDKSARNRPFYCFGCWAKVGTEFCQQCSEFAKGHRDTKREARGNKNSFYCEPCWVKYEERKGRKGGDAKKDDKEETSGKKSTTADETSTRGRRGQKKEGEASANNKATADSNKKDGSSAKTADKAEKPQRGERRQKGDATAKTAADETTADKKAASTNKREPREKKAAAAKDKDAATTEASPKADGRKKGGRGGDASAEDKKPEDAAEKAEKAAKKKAEAAAKKAESSPKAEKKEAAAGDESGSEDDKEGSLKKSRRGRRGGRGRKGGKEGEGENSASASGEVPAAPVPKPAATVLASA